MANAAIGDERHCVFKCLYYGGLQLDFAQLFDDAHNALRNLMLHQKTVAGLILTICERQAPSYL